MRHVLHGDQRTYYSVHLIALTCVLAVAISGIAGALMAWQLSEQGNDRAYRSDVHSCQRGNDVRRESNRRIVVHARGAHNLEALALAMAQTRAAEAKAFAAIGAHFGISEQTAPLVKALWAARDRDLRIAASQHTVRFLTLAIYDCSDPHVVPRP